MNHMKMHKYVIILRNRLNINILKKKKIVKLEIIVIIQVNIEVLHIVHVI